MLENYKDEIWGNYQSDKRFIHSSTYLQENLKMAKPKLGSGGRFKALTSKLESQGMSEEGAKANAAAIGRKKYGAKKMSEMAKAGRKK